MGVLLLWHNNIVLGEFAGYYTIPQLYRHLREYYYDLVGCQVIPTSG